MQRLLVGTMVLGACVAPDSTEISTQDIHGDGAALASQWQRDRAATLGFCSATRIGPRFVLTALHCMTQVGNTVTFYTGGPGKDTTRTARVEEVMQRPGTNASVCFNDMNCDDSSGHWADIVVLRVSNDVTPSIDSLSGAQATLAWRYPGDDVWGTNVGGGRHDDLDNPNNILKQIDDPTDDSNDSDGSFHTATDDVNPGDSGGPFYVNGRVLGTLTGHGNIGLDTYSLHTSVPFHLDWILSKIGYTWIGAPPQMGRVYDGNLLESFQSTTRICQYACEKTQSCQAYNYNFAASSCGLYTNITGSHTQAGWIGALHYGASTGKSNEVVGYVRSDGFNSVVHKGTNGNVHELFHDGSTWSNGQIAPMAGQPIAGKLTAYRRADGINAVVYRSTSGRIIELALTSNGWVAGDLTSFGGQLAAGDPTAYVRADGVSAVVFRSADGHINELRLGTKAWLPTDLSAVSGSTSVPASSDPTPYVRSDGFSSVVYRSGGSIIELFKSATAQWAVGGPSSLANAPAATGRPYGYTRKNGNAAIVYRSTANRLIELFLDASGWHFSDLTSTGQPVGGNPIAFVRQDAIESVYYRSTTSQLNELTRSPLQAWNLSAQYGVFPATTDPAVYIRNDQTADVVFGLASNHAGGLSYDASYGWGWTDLTLSAGESP